MRFLPHWRKATWAIVVWTAIFAIWIVGGLASADIGQNCLGADQGLCEAAQTAGTGIGVFLVGMIWFIGFIILAIVWFMSRPRYVEYRGRMMKESEAKRLSDQEYKGGGGRAQVT